LNPVDLKHSPPKTSRLKTLWRDRRSRPWSFFCPQCRAARKVGAHPNPGRLENYGRVGLCAMVFTLATWKWFGMKGIVSFVPLWAAFEMFYRARMRSIMACPHCGFDPYLYLADVQLARKEIEGHWRKKFAEHGTYPKDKHGAVDAPPAQPAEAEITREPDTGELEPPSRGH
jgi:hypothetical protein